MSRRIALFDFVTHFGGAQRSVTNILRHLSSAATVKVIDAYGSCREFTDVLESHGISRVVLEPDASRVVIGGTGQRARRWAALASALPGMVRMTRRLQGALRAFRPDAIFSLSTKSLAVLRFTPAARRVPVILYNGGECDPRRFGPLSRWLVTNVPSAIIVLFEGAKANLVSMGARPEKIHVIPTGTDLEGLAALAKKPLARPLPQSDRKFRAIVPATLIPAKGQATAIRALGRLVASNVDAALFLAGDVPPGASDDYVERLRQIARECDVADRVEFLGWRSDLPQIFTRCSLLILPTLTEGLPRTIAEGMAVGCPVAASPVGGVPDLIIPGRTGWLCEADDPGAFANAMSDATDGAFRERIVSNARDHLRDHFSVARQMEGISRMLSEYVASDTQPATDNPPARSRE